MNYVCVCLYIFYVEFNFYIFLCMSFACGCVVCVRGAFFRVVCVLCAKGVCGFV